MQRNDSQMTFRQSTSLMATARRLHPIFFIIAGLVHVKKLARVLSSVHVISVYMLCRAHGVLDQCAASIIVCV